MDQLQDHEVRIRDLEIDVKSINTEFVGMDGKSGFLEEFRTFRTERQEDTSTIMKRLEEMDKKREEAKRFSISTWIAIVSVLVAAAAVILTAVA